MKIVIMHYSRSVEEVIRHVSAVPRIGDKVDIFQSPPPRVVDIVWYPAKEQLKEQDIEAIVVVD